VTGQLAPVNSTS